MTDLLDALWEYGATFDATVAVDDAAPALTTSVGLGPLVTDHRATRPQPVALRLGLIAVVGLAAGATIAVMVDRPARPTISNPSTPVVAVPDPTVTAPPDTSATPEPATTLPPEPAAPAHPVWPDDARETLKLLPPLEPTWLPEGIGEPEIHAFDRSKARTPGLAADSWIQIYVNRASNPSVVVVGASSRPSEPPPIHIDPPNSELAERLADSLVTRADRRGWNLPDLPASYSLIAEGSERAPSIRRQWADIDRQPLRLVIGTAPRVMTAIDFITGNPTTIFEVRGHLAFAATSPAGGEMVGWEESLGVYAMVYGDRTREELVRVAESLQPTDVATYQQLIDTLEIHAYEPESEAIHELTAPPTGPLPTTGPLLLPTALPDGFKPLNVEVFPTDDHRGTWEQHWLGPETTNPAAVTLQANPQLVWESEGWATQDNPTVRIGGRRAAFDPEAPNILNMEDDTGGTLSILSKGMTTEQLIAFAAGLTARSDGIAYEAAVLPAGLESFGEGWFGGDGAGWQLCWRRGEQTACLALRSDPDGGPHLRAFDVHDQERVALGEHEAFLPSPGMVTWMVTPNVRLSLATSGLSRDETLAIARSIAEADPATFHTVWTAAGGT